MNDVIDEINIHLNRAFYKPIGYCIYCGSNGDGKELSSEHIFPYFLGGNVELEASSCNSCAKITSYLDGHCANKLFGTIRTQLGLQTRRPKHRQTDFPVIFETDAGLITRHVPIQETDKALCIELFNIAKLRALPGFSTRDRRMPEAGTGPPVWRAATSSLAPGRCRKLGHGFSIVI